MASEYGELINLDNLHYAPVLDDGIDAYQAGTDKYLAPAAEMKKEAKVDASPRCYDGKAMFVSPIEASTDVTLTVSGVPARLEAELTGKPYDQAHGIMIDTGDQSQAPYFALSARGELGDGGYRYYQFLKGRFSMGAETAKTKEEKITASTIELNYTGLVTIHEFEMPSGSKRGIKGMKGDTTDAAFGGADAWFSQVQTPETLGKPVVLTMTSNPADKATSVAAGVKPVLTFNNQLKADAVTIVKADGSLVAADKAYDSTGKILTITPEASLTSGATYSIIVAGVVDIFGQSLDPTAIKFTVAS